MIPAGTTASEVGVVSGMSSPAMRVSLLLGWAALAATAILRPEPLVPTVVGLSVALLGVIVVTSPGPDRLPRWVPVTMLALSALLVAAAIALGVHVGRLGFLLVEVCGYQMAMLAMRGNVVAAWLGAVLRVGSTGAATILRPAQAPTA